MWVDISDMEDVADVSRKLRTHECDGETYKQTTVYLGQARSNVDLIRSTLRHFMVDSRACHTTTAPPAPRLNAREAGDL
jgi:hypothetical protein